MKNQSYNKTNYDIVVVGAGPAGSATAIILAQAGYRVAIIDSISPRRPKVGESITAATMRLLRRIGINSLSDLLTSNQYKPCVANVSAWGSNQWVYQDAIQNPEGHGWHINRKQFDKALLRRAIEHKGVFIKGKLRTVQKNKEGYAINWFRSDKKKSNAIIHTKWIIDATGRASKVA